jgi:hypothetical protein
MPERANRRSPIGEREQSVEDYLDEQVRLAGGETRKLSWLGRRNANDRLVLLPTTARHPVVEVKKRGLAATFPRPGDAHEQAQWREHCRLRAAGFEVWVIDSKQGVHDVIEGKMP